MEKKEKHREDSASKLKKKRKNHLDAEEVDNDQERNSIDLCQPGLGKALQIAKRKLIVHLDLNNTILVSDAVTNQGPRSALNSYLSTVTWGKMSETGEWQWLTDSLSLLPPCQAAVNYYSQFGPETDFTNTAPGRHFKDVYTDHLRLLEWSGEADEVFSTTGEDGKRYHWILPSFFHLLESLHLEGRHFTVVLRTFGTDLPRVLHSIRCALEGQHPHFPHLRLVSLPVDQIPGRIRCNKREVILSRGCEQVSTKPDARNIYSYFSSLEGIGGFQDHFDWWARNRFTSKGGKPFWIDPDDISVQHIFIDDNIRADGDYNIVFPQVFLKRADGHIRTALASELYNICLVQTNLLRAIAEKNYFLECVKDCEEKYDRYIASSETE
ncbi:uncharacterized protein LOC115472860 isoform X1 [Microcaecilia unicolor]|uniref:Uncharacterized protein LOC115472860 isoform X1 n=1 Tax=Microcaecilia unicolor TaxID=1415580 RepID=A0A6P7Y6P1_9AMPH|nr:uncharacterized protein LOC115472860 isoform X1 [Microcaecilia unicolor]